MFIGKKDLNAVRDELVKLIHHLGSGFSAELEERLKNVPHKDVIKEEVLLAVDKRLIEFHKEIADKYFESLVNFIRWNKELAIVQYVKDKTGDTELGKIKLELMKPYLDEKFAVTRAEQSEKINQLLQTKGEEIRKRKEEIYQQYLKLQREGKDFTDAKAQYDILQELFGS